MCFRDVRLVKISLVLRWFKDLNFSSWLCFGGKCTDVILYAGDAQGQTNLSRFNLFSSLSTVSEMCF